MPIPLSLLVGFCIAVVGTMIGAGGGFLLTPVLLLLHPSEPPEHLTSLSLFVVLCNSASGTIGYARRGLVSFTTGFAFIAAALPGAILGASLTHRIPRGVFDPVMGVFLGVASFYLAWRSRHPFPKPANADGPPLLSPRQWTIGVGASLAIGLIASLLGIGGGIMHVPLLVYALHFPVHRATATSHFVLAATSAAAVAFHIAAHELDGRWGLAIPLGIGAVCGAQVGAALARRVHARAIILALSAALAAVAVRILVRSL